MANRSPACDIGRVLHQIIQHSPVATFVIDKAHRITQRNVACAQMTGRDAADMLGRDDTWQAFHSERRPLLADLIVDGCVDQDRTEVRRVQRELALNYDRIKQTNSRLEEAQNQLLQSEKMASIGQLAASVAHEINNPIDFVSSNLGTLRGYVEPVFGLLAMLKNLPADTLPAGVRAELKNLDNAVDLDFVQEDLPQLLNESEEGLSRVKKIVRDLKDFSRVDHADWQDADLNAGLDSTLNVVMNEVKYKAEVRKNYAVPPPVHCIAAQLNQVFMNLIVNAAHAIKERGIITLASRAEGEWVCIEISDTGSGMSEDVKRRSFEPFYTTKPVGQGTGLGLSLSFSIVQKHGGRIEVESEVGVGTRFRVWIPVHPPVV